MCNAFYYILTLFFVKKKVSYVCDLLMDCDPLP